MSNSLIEFPKSNALLERKSTTTEMATSRQAQEVQAAMVIAKKFPRDEQEAFQRIETACKRTSLAEQAIYTYPRGGTQVEGPSIRLAECLAQNWGNIDFGIIELEQKQGESTVMAFAWDLQTNTRQTKIFQVPHVRRAGKENKVLDDPRDIYEMVANQGARRLRACVLGVIPGDIVEAAVDMCNKTMKGGGKEPLIDRVRKMVSAFSEFSVTVGMIEKRLGHKLEATSETEMVTLRKIFTSIKDGMSKREDWFSMEAAEANVPSKSTIAEAAKITEGDIPYDTAPVADSPKMTEPKPEPVQSPAPVQQSKKSATVKMEAVKPEAAPAPTGENDPRYLLAKLIAEKGYTVEELNEYLSLAGHITAGAGFEDFDAVPLELAQRLMKSKTGLLACLSVQRENAKNQSA